MPHLFHLLLYRSWQKNSLWKKENHCIKPINLQDKLAVTALWVEKEFDMKAKELYQTSHQTI